jgi:hypothetical protein
MTLGNIAITGTATPGKRRVNAGAAAAGMAMTGAMTAGGVIDITPRAIVVMVGGTVIVIKPGFRC